ncbi:MAG: cell wall metabolism sensor histidine kinase WalK [Firmicutes bacterium]|jgi:PAS domain S-box-containing protein|nr:cell wall metabolism sensor histidine kinase WalK [Bacillota bacterium]
MRSLFGRLLSSYLIIILLTALSVGFSLSRFFTNYYRMVLGEELTQQAEQLASRLAIPLELDEEVDVEYMIDSFEDCIGVGVWLVDNLGIVRETSERYADWRGARIEGSLQRELAAGRTVVYRRGEGPLAEGIITVAVPIRTADGVGGGVLLHYPVRGIARTLRAVRPLFYRTLMWAVLLSVGVGFFMSRKLAKPLQEMTAISLEMSRGNFDKRVQEVSQDEVGQLARAFNHLAEELGRSIHALTQEKSKSESILVSMTDGVIACDAEGRVMLMNPKAVEFCGRPEASAIGEDLREVIPDPLVVESFQETLASGRRCELEVERGSKAFLVRISPITGPGGENWGSVALLNDISSRRELEEMRRQFVANVSHELRTPLTSIRGFLQAILDGVVTDPASVRKYMRIMLAECLRLIRLSNSLLDLSRIEGGSIELYREEVELGPLVQEIFDRLLPAIDDKELKVSLGIQPGFPPLLVDRDRMAQVMLNIIDNAVRFTPKGGRILVQAAVEDGRAVIRVRDTGPGIDPEELPLIWERFYKGDKSRRSGPGGTGLGLVIVKQLVEKHGGFVDVECPPEGGAVFIVSLPLRQEVGVVR